MKKLFNYIKSNAWRLRYIFCNRYIMSYGFFFALLIVSANVDKTNLKLNYYLLIGLNIVIVFVCAYIVCVLSNIKPNKWEKPLIEWIKEQFETD